MRGCLSYAYLMGVVGVFCTGAWAVDAPPVMSVRLGGYTPNDYGACRTTDGVFGGTGNPCTVSSDCTVGGETCGKFFRDISCSAIGAVGDAECLDATRGPSKCEQIELLAGPTLRCSAVGLAPQGMVGPGDTLFLEVFADAWDQTPDEGLCSSGASTCDRGVAVEPCRSCRTIFVRPTLQGCVDNAECAEGLECVLDKHCSNNSSEWCEIDPDCVSSADCIPDTCDVFPSIAVYQWAMDSSGFSNGNGPASRLILRDLPCTTETVLDDCKHGYSSNCTDCSAASCDGGTCSPQADNFVFKPRADFIFSELGPVVGCSSATMDVRCGAQISADTQPVADDGTHRYLGTTVVTVSDGACGTFRVGLIENSIETFFKDGFGLSLKDPVTNSVTLIIGPRGDCGGPCADDGDLCTTDECNCAGFCVHPTIDLECPAGEVCIPSTGECGPPVGCELLDMTSTPAHCSIDPGIPHAIGNTVPAFGWKDIDLTFGTVNDCDTSELTTGDFSVAVTPNDVAVGVGGVVTTGTNTATVTLTVPIPAGHWVCLTHDGPAATGGPEMTCLGALPADANATQKSSAEDIAAVIDCLVSGTCEVWKCDIDRLEACTGADIEETVNLLNGAGEFIIWDQAALDTLPACPAP